MTRRRHCRDVELADDGAYAHDYALPRARYIGVAKYAMPADIDAEARPPRARSCAIAVRLLQRPMFSSRAGAAPILMLREQPPRFIRVRLNAAFTMSSPRRRHHVYAQPFVLPPLRRQLNATACRLDILMYFRR